MRTDRKRKTLGRILTAGLLAAAVFLAAHGGALCVQAETGSSGTKVKVIRTSSDDEFAQETAKLAKNSRGLSVQSKGEVRRYSSGRLIVRVRDGESLDFSRYGASTVIQSTFGVSIVQFPSAASAQKAAKALAALSSVVYVDADDCTLNTGDTQIREISMDGGSSSEQEIPSDSETGEPGSLQIGGRTYGQDEDILFETSVRANAAGTSTSGMSWGASYIQADKYAAFVKANTSQTIKVAVVDSGVSSHTKLKGRILKGRDYVDNDSNPTDKNGHGTHVAGTIVDCTPGINVRILPVRVMNASGIGNPSNVGNGIRYAVNQGAKVINLSLGGYSHYKFIEECINYAQSRNVTVVVAAGNDGDNTKFICPAHMSSPIIVGAINKSGKRAFFSNYGSSLDIMAPGVDIKSCWLGGKYATASGTSMAAPHISAAAAMYRLMNPSASASRIQYLVRCYAKDLGAKGTDNYYGRGVPRMAGAITPSKVTLNKKTTSLQLKKTLTLKASITPSYAGKNKLTWSSSNKGVVTVSGGKLTAKKRGTATITVRTVNGKKATCKVTVTNPAVSASSAQVKALQDNIASSFLSKAREPAAAVETAAAKTTIEEAAAEKTAAAKTTTEKAAAEKSAAAKTAAAEKTSRAASKTAEAEAAAAEETVVAAAESTAAEEKVTAAAESAAAEESPAGNPAEPVTDRDSAPGGNADPVKVYIYPSDAADNAPLQDGSIITGSRLRLEAEIVPAPQENGGLAWASSDPSVAEVDEEGVVTALSQGQTTITAVLPAAPALSGAEAGEKSAGADSGADAQKESLSAPGAWGTGSFTIHVVPPSVLTRHASYDAGSGDRQRIQAVLRLPGTIEADAAAGLSDSPSYVLALLCEEEGSGTPVLLGAVNLGGADNGSLHLHEASGGTMRKGIRSPGAAVGDDGSRAARERAAKALLSSGGITGKTAVQTGILAVEDMEADGGKADLSLTADIGILRSSDAAADDTDKEESRTVRNCLFSVYTLEAFEAREKAVEEGETELVRKTDAEALCSCRFTLAFEGTGDPAEDRTQSGPAGTEEELLQEPAEKQNGFDPEQTSGSPAAPVTTGISEEGSAGEQTGEASFETEISVEEDGSPAPGDMQEKEEFALPADAAPGTASGQSQENGCEVEENAVPAAENPVENGAGAGADRAQPEETKEQGGKMTVQSSAEPVEISESSDPAAAAE